MLIPIEAESAEAFILRARETLARDKTHLYIDTSLAMWLTAVGPSSRAAFMKWAATLEQRIHVPVWTIQEFFRHHDSNTQVNGIAEKCVAVDKALGELSAHMRVYADGRLVPGQPEMAFANTLAAASDKVRDALKLARDWDYSSAAAEVIKWMNDHALATTEAFDAFGQLQGRGSARYRHEVPPGFEDGHKSVNRFGDLLFWEDVIADAKDRKAEVVGVLTRDRKKDWFFAGLKGEVSEDLKRLRGTWEPVPVPHPLLALELRSAAKAELLLIDELYLGAIMWSVDKHEYGRLAAVSFGMKLDRLAAATAPLPKIPERAAKRSVDDVVSYLEAVQLVKAAKAAASATADEVLNVLEGEAPAVETAIASFNPERIGLLSSDDLAVLARRLYYKALAGPSVWAVLAGRILDSVDKVDALHASAIVGGMLVGAYYDGITPRDRPIGDMLQQVFEWRGDNGITRTLHALSRDLTKLRSSALYLPSPANDQIDVRIEASAAVVTTPIAVGQVFFGPQAVLVDTAIEPERLLSNLLGGTETSVSNLVQTLARFYGVPLDLVQETVIGNDEQRAILVTTGVERFDPSKLPRRPSDRTAPGKPAPVPAMHPEIAAAIAAEVVAAEDALIEPQPPPIEGDGAIQPPDQQAADAGDGDEDEDLSHDDQDDEE
jgi:hypothetical protein